MAEQDNDLVAKTVVELALTMPGIGILDNKTRAQAYLATCKKATELASKWGDTEVESEAWAIDLLKCLWETNKNFRKVTQTIILNLERIEVSSMGVVGSGFAGGMCNRYGIRAYFRSMVPDGLEESAWG